MICHSNFISGEPACALVLPWYGYSLSFLFAQQSLVPQQLSQTLCQTLTWANACKFL